MTLDIGLKENTAIQQLNEQLAHVASTQKKYLEAGVVDLAHFGALKVSDDIIDMEVS